MIVINQISTYLLYRCCYLDQRNISMKQNDWNLVHIFPKHTLSAMCFCNTEKNVWAEAERHFPKPMQHFFVSVHWSGGRWKTRTQNYVALNFVSGRDAGSDSAIVMGPPRKRRKRVLTGAGCKAGLHYILYTFLWIDLPSAKRTSLIVFRTKYTLCFMEKILELLSCLVTDPK